MKKLLICYLITNILLWNTHIFAQLRDPTRPVSFTDTDSSSPWQLSAIIISAKRRVAVINDKSMQIGDIVFDQKVIAIESNYVILEGPEGKMTLYLLDKQIKH